MKILLFNEDSRVISDRQNATHQQLSKDLESLGHTVTSISTSEGAFHGCTGCWSCWLKTPGECAVKDDQVPFIKKFLKSDLVIMLSPVRKGFISAQLKKSIDRLIPLSLPFFEIKEGQFTHKNRYDKLPDMALLLEFETDLDKENDAIISNWINRFCWHLDTKCHVVSDINLQPVSEIIKEIYSTVIS